jgi:hypothetical protein
VQHHAPVPPAVAPGVPRLAVDHADLRRRRLAEERRHLRPALAVPSLPGSTVIRPRHGKRRLLRPPYGSGKPFPAGTSIITNGYSPTANPRRFSSAIACSTLASAGVPP